MIFSFAVDKIFYHRFIGLSLSTAVPLYFLPRAGDCYSLKTAGAVEVHGVLVGGQYQAFKRKSLKNKINETSPDALFSEIRLDGDMMNPSVGGLRAINPNHAVDMVI